MTEDARTNGSVGQAEDSDIDGMFSAQGRFRALLDRALKFALGVHVLLIVLFFLREVYLLALVNVGSVLIYIFTIYLVRQGKGRRAIFLAWLEILGHAAICTLVIGFDTGFHYYILVLLPMIYVNAYRSMASKIGVTALLCGVYMGLVYLSEHMPPTHGLSQISVDIMRYGNIFTCVAMIATQSHVYGQSVIDGENDLKQINRDLKRALAEVKTLQGILPICSFCKKIRDDKGYWEQVDVYIGEHSRADISHSICPDCLKKHYPDYSQDMEEWKSSEQ